MVHNTNDCGCFFIVAPPPIWSAMSSAAVWE
jgi:hypothetical protein